ncbi:hypothetical protein VUR80DRAFT_8938 [Thermomyces stellatus]
MFMGRANGNIDERHVKVGQHLGQRDEKDGSYESSVMQQTCVYPVKLSGRTIWLIDTPRIGDTCGLEHDKQGMADIVNTLQLWLSDLMKDESIEIQIKKHAMVPALKQVVMEKLSMHICDGTPLRPSTTRQPDASTTMIQKQEAKVQHGKCDMSLRGLLNDRQKHIKLVEVDGARH